MPCGKFSVSEIRTPKIFHREWKIDANYFGFRNSETEIVSTNFPCPVENFRFPKFGTEIVSTNFPCPVENFRFPKFGNRKFSTGNGRLMLTISVSEFRKPKWLAPISRSLRKIFGFRNSETENFPPGMED